MSITVECADCEKKYRVPDDRAGDVIRCKACGAKIAIPVEEDDDDFEPLRPVKKKAARKKKKSSGSTGLVIGLVVGGVAVLGGLMVGLVMFLPRGGNGNAPVAQAGPANPGAIAQPPGTAAPATSPGAAAAPAGLKWAVAVDPPKSPVAWPDQPPAIDGLRGSLDQMIFASTASPFAVTGVEGMKDICRVINLATGETAGKFSNPRPEFHGKQGALHPAGSLLAVPGKFSGTEPAKVGLWDVKQGSQSVEFPVNKSSPLIDWLDFGPHGELVTLETGNLDGKFQTRLSLFDCTTGKSIRQFSLIAHLSLKQISFSPGRRYLAIVHAGSAPLTFYDLAQGLVAGQIPTGEIGASSASIHATAFSPDGSLFTTLSSERGIAAITLFDVATGDRKSQTRFPADATRLTVFATLNGGNPLQWLPDSSGWLVGGESIVDRTTGRVLWKLDAEPNEYGLANSRPRIPTPQGIWIVEGKDDDGKLTLIPSPWTKAREILARQTDAANLLRPGASVGLKVEIGEVRFAQKEAAQQALNDAFQDRLKTEKLTTAEDQPVMMRVAYSEGKGATLQEFKQDLNPLAKSPLNPQGVATGRAVEATNAVIELSLTDSSGKTVYWKHRHAVEQFSAFMKGELTAEAVRQQMFEGLVRSIASLPLPYYLTADKDGPQLPLVHHWPHW